MIPQRTGRSARSAFIAALATSETVCGAACSRLSEVTDGEKTPVPSPAGKVTRVHRSMPSGGGYLPCP